MAHFVRIDENNEIIEAIVVANEDVNNLSFPSSEVVGQTFIASLGLEGQWLQTSYNNNFRVRYASVGMVYNSVLDQFEEKKSSEWTEQ